MSLCTQFKCFYIEYPQLAHGGLYEQPQCVSIWTHGSQNVKCRIEQSWVRYNNDGRRVTKNSLHYNTRRPSWINEKASLSTKICRFFSHPTREYLYEIKIIKTKNLSSLTVINARWNVRIWNSERHRCDSQRKMHLQVIVFRFEFQAHLKLV